MLNSSMQSMKKAASSKPLVGAFKNMNNLRQFSQVHEKQEKSCGILGGLGPEATINFLQCILKKTSELYEATQDQNHIRTVVEMNPKVPNRNYAIFGTGEDCGPVLGRMSQNLKRANVDFVVCACNTAHAFQKDIEEGCGDIPFVSMIEVTSNQVLKNIINSSSSRKCGILGGGGCIEAGLFQRCLSARGIEPVTPCKENQDLLQSIIYRIKAGDKGSQVIEDFVTLLKELKEENNCSQIILGCTELPLIIEDSLAIYDGVSAENLVDSSEVMVEAVVRIAKGDLEIEQAVDFSSFEESQKSTTAEFISSAASAELAE